MKRIAPLSLLPLLLAAACDAPRAAAERASPAILPVAAAAHVDSAESIDVLLGRFRADLPEAPKALTSGAGSREELIERFVRALETGDTAAFEPLALSRAEFAYLYYPSSPMAQPPYELPPALMWARTQAASRTGVLRALRAYGGRSLDYAGSRCPEPLREGENRLWGGCVLRLGSDEVRLFGTIVERGGRFSFLSLANDL